jgi:phosphopantetheinyl transferase
MGHVISMIYVIYKKLSPPDATEIDLELEKRLDSFYSATDPPYKDIPIKEKRAQKLDVFLLLSKLFKYLKISNFQSYKLFKSNKGKPTLKSLDINSQTYFISITHSKQHVAVALSKDFDVGLDVESSNRFLNHKAHKKWLHKNELEALKDLSPDKLTQIWTRKEALTKATGLGYALVFKSIDLSQGSDVTVVGSDTYVFVTKKMDKTTSVFSLCFMIQGELQKDCSPIEWVSY